MAKEIPLTQGKVTIVDDEDYESLMQFKWYAHRNRQGRWYAKRSSTGNLHRWLLSAPPHLDIDHRNGDGLDNQRHNLRLATRSQNAVNTGKKKNNTSGFKGVHYRKKEKRWYAATTFKGSKIYLGLFINIEDAARAYDAAVLALHGEFAYLNFPKQVEGEK